MSQIKKIYHFWTRYLLNQGTQTTKKSKYFSYSLVFIIFFIIGLISFQNCNDFNLLDSTITRPVPGEAVVPPSLGGANMDTVTAAFFSDHCPSQAVVRTPEWIKTPMEVRTPVSRCNLISFQNEPNSFSTAQFIVPSQMSENYRTIEFYFLDSQNQNVSPPKKLELRPRLFSFNRLGVGYNIPSLIGIFTNLRETSIAKRDTYLSLGKRAIADAYIAGAQHVVVLIPGYFPFTGTDLYNSTTQKLDPSQPRNDIQLWAKGEYENNQLLKTAYWKHFDRMMNEIAKYGLGIILRGWTESTLFPNLVNAFEFKDSPNNYESSHDFIARTNSKSYLLYLKYMRELFERYRDYPEFIAFGLPNELNLNADLALNYRCQQGCEIPQNPPKTPAEISICKQLACQVFKDFTTEELAQFYSRVVPLFQDWGRQRSSALYHLPPLKIIPGTGVARPAAYHMSLTPERASQTGTDASGNPIITVSGPDWTEDQLDQFASYVKKLFDPFEIVDFHTYNSNGGGWTPGWLELNRFNDPECNLNVLLKDAQGHITSNTKKVKIEELMASNSTALYSFDVNMARAKYETCRFSTHFLQIAHQVFTDPSKEINKSLYIGELGEGQIDGIENYQFTQNVLSLISKENQINASVWAMEFFQFNTYTYQNGGSQLDELKLDLGNSKVHPLFYQMVQKRQDLMDDLRFSTGGNRLANGVRVLITHPFHDALYFEEIDPKKPEIAQPIINVVASSESLTISKVEVWVDNNYHLLTQFPYQLPSTHYSPGAHIIKAKATDTGGNSATHEIKFHVAGANSQDSDVVIYDMGVGGCSSQVNNPQNELCGIWTSTLNTKENVKIYITFKNSTGANETREVPLGGFTGASSTNISSVTFPIERNLLLEGISLYMIVDQGLNTEKKSNTVFFYW